MATSIPYKEKFTTGNLFERCGMEDIVNPLHRILQRAFVAYIANIELNLMRNIRVIGLILVTHVILLLLISGEDADFANNQYTRSA